MSVHIILLLEAFLAQHVMIRGLCLWHPDQSVGSRTELIYYNARNGYKDLDHLGPGKFMKVHCISLRSPAWDISWSLNTRYGEYDAWVAVPSGTGIRCRMPLRRLESRGFQWNSSKRRDQYQEICHCQCLSFMFKVSKLNTDGLRVGCFRQ